MGSFLLLPNGRPGRGNSDSDPLNCTVRATLPQVDNLTVAA